jgi:hypothetical protein
MADYFKQVREAAERGGASEPFNYAMDRLPSMGEAGAGAVGGAANYLAPETVDYTKQLIDAAKEQYLEPARQQFNEMLPTGVTVSGSPSLTNPTLTPRLDLNAVSPYVQGSAEATLGQQGLLGYNVNAQVPMGGGFTGVGNYGPQGGNVGINYAQGGLSANVSAPVSERTDSVKSLLNNITAGFRYTRNF